MIRAFIFVLLLCLNLFALPNPYDGVAKIRKCSASVVKFAGQKDSDQVLLLSNGHCVSSELLGADAIVDRAYRDVATIYRGKTPLIVGSLNVTRIVYATMSGTDVAILSTDLTYKELKQKLHILPLELGEHLPLSGDSLSVSSGNLEQSYRCCASGIVNVLKEDKWQWHNALRINKSSGCFITAGASGSPVLDEAGKIVALINTGNEGGAACSLHSPCEIGPNGSIEAYKDAIYAVDVSMLNACFRSGKFEFSKECALAKPQIHYINILPLDGKHPH